jgi:hypothetical protein
MGIDTYKHITPQPSTPIKHAGSEIINRYTSFQFQQTKPLTSDEYLSPILNIELKKGYWEEIELEDEKNGGEIGEESEEKIGRV